jgi:hypothetical protein
MKRLLAMVLLLTLAPAVSASAQELEELLDRSREASYTAEQVISCMTPDGTKNAVVSLEQTGAGLHVTGEVEVSAGYGGWELVREGAVVNSASVTAEDVDAEPTYVVDDGTAHPFLNRKAGLYKLYDGDVLRAELIVDGGTGALLSVVTYNEDGSVYCERKFVEFQPSTAEEPATTMESTEALEPGAAAEFPESLGDFRRLDIYEDGDGLVFAYYSDGFFSFAVFRTPTLVPLDDPSAFVVEDDAYARAFSPGQVTLTWETRDGGMAMVGDLPPDMHAGVLAGLAPPSAPGFLQRVWRSLFG